MPRHLRADRRSLKVTVPGQAQTVDILFDEHRVWSTRLPEPGRSGTRRIEWPSALTPYLKGSSEVTVRSSATGKDLAVGEVGFGGPGRVEITDTSGRWLAMNKWNRLGPSFEGDSSGMQERLLGATARLVDQLLELGYPVYMVGGTLLGAMRSGGLLPHDDDVDLAYLCSKTDPQDVSLVSFEMERQLTGLGYIVVRHSHAHLELVFLTGEGGNDFYIDIFTGYHSGDGLYNQPFALRGKLARRELLPAKVMPVNGVDLPAPAVPEAWLEFAYGPNWRIPDPSFTFEPPRSTLRRFENTFGVFNRQRVYWEKSWQRMGKRDDSDADDDLPDVERFLRLLPETAFVVDLGCGAGRQAERIAEAGHEVVAVDYSFEALRLARQTQPRGVEYRFLNLNDRHALVLFVLDLIAQGRRPFFFARNLLHTMTTLGRADLFTVARGVLDDETFLFATFDADTAPRVAANPQTWALDLTTLRSEAWRFRLGVTVLGDRIRPTPHGDRTNLTALVWR